MLAKNAEDRPASAGVVADELAKFCSGSDLVELANSARQASRHDSAGAPTMDDASTEPISAPCGDSDSSLVTPNRDKSFSIVAAIAALLVLALAAGFWISRRSPPMAAIIVRAESEEIAQQLSMGAASLESGDSKIPLRSGRQEVPSGSYDLAAAFGSRLTFSQPRIDLERNQQLLLLVSRSTPPDSVAIDANVAIDARGNDNANADAAPKGYPKLDLISLLEPARDVAGDDWQIVDGALVSQPDRLAQVLVPYRPSEHYRVELTATRLENDEELMLGLPAGERPVTMVIDGASQLGWRSGLNEINQVGLTGRRTDVRRGQLLPIGKPVAISATVQRSGLRATVELSIDGEVVTSWRGSTSQATENKGLSPTEPNAMCLRSNHTKFRIEDLRIATLGGNGEVIQFTDPDEHPQRAAAEYVIWKGGVVSVIDAVRAVPPTAIGGFELIREFKGHKGMVKTVAISDDDRLAASGSGWPSGDHTLRIWDMATGHQLHVLDMGEDVMSVAFSPNDHQLIVAGGFSGLVLVDAETGKRVRDYDTADMAKFEEARFTPDGNRIVASAGRSRVVYIFERDTGELVHRLPQESDVLALAVTPNGRQLAIGLGDGSVELVEIASGATVRQFEGPGIVQNPFVYCLDISRDGKRIMAGYKQRTVRLWELENGRLLRDITTETGGHETVAFTPDGRHAVVSGTNGIVCYLDLESGRVLGTSAQILGQGWAAALSADGSNVLVGGGVRYENGWKYTGDYVMRLWRIGAAEEQPGGGVAPVLNQVTVDRLTNLADDTRIGRIDMRGSSWWRDEDAAHLSGLPDLERLDLSQTETTSEGLVALRSLGALKRLNLSSTPVERIDPLTAEGFPSLKQLELFNAPVGTEQIEAMSRTRPELEIIAGDGAVDVMALVDLNRDLDTEHSGGRRWMRNGDRLITAEQSRISLPVELPSDFDFSMTTAGIANRNAPIMGFALAGGGHFAVGLDSGSQSGFDATLYGIDESEQLVTPTQDRADKTIASPSESMQVLVRVRAMDEQINVDVLKNGIEVISWEGDRSRLNQSNVWWIGPHSRQPWVSQYGGPLRIEKMDVTAVKGRVRQATPTAGDKPEATRKTVLDLRGREIDDDELRELLKQTVPVRLSLEGPEITDASISQISSLPFLEGLYLYGTSITNDGIARLVPRTSLTACGFLSMPQITDDVTKHLSKMPRLRRVTFKESGVNGSGLERLHHASMRDVLVGSHLLDGQILEQAIVPFGELNVLDLAGTRITDDDVALLKRVQGVISLHLGFNPEIKGPGLVHIKEMTSLRTLYLDRSGVDDESLEFLVGANQILVLYLRRLPITDDAIETILRFPKLRRLYITETEISPEGVGRLKRGLPFARVITDATP